MDLGLTVFFIVAIGALIGMGAVSYWYHVKVAPKMAPEELAQEREEMQVW